ncbi:ABC1 family protein MCP2 [Seminavis robusta]|uniref:ABC1 family protein MCP2 n=1 Tax=Seminavis robusta TaxID=568900 RepID=A0A9N8E0G4_9STRA|nr:ABC1 family protein MCP2 [Seminavis robusta]|eukprot:Sro522_g159680.1 ABC1 family protein MCP2 (745) ;mRNA; f:57599-60043
MVILLALLLLLLLSSSCHFPCCSAFVPSTSLAVKPDWSKQEQRLRRLKMPPLLDPSSSAGHDVVDSQACNGYWCLLFGGGKQHAGMLPTAMASGTSSFLTTSWKNKSSLVTTLVTILLLCAATMFYMHVLNPSFGRGMQRIFQFWTSVTPWIVEYKSIQWNLRRLPPETNQHRMKAFHQKTAPKAIALVQRMGGIYVKMGQVLSTIGVGILHDDYIQALRPLQDGIPPRPIQEMAAIFQQSTGQRIEDVFEWMDSSPIGAASIGQAHKAVLKKNNPNDPDDVVIVKIQYPQVAEQFTADLNNLELCLKIVQPGCDDMMRGLRERHSRELDFREEAQHLRECADNMKRHQLEPAHIRIPMVRNETGLCTQHVLVMEYLQGTTLHAAIAQEQDRMARALGQEGGGDALREFILEQIGEHLEQTHAHDENDTHHHDNKGGGDWSAISAGGGADLNPLQRIAMGPVGAAVFRTYVGVRNGLDNLRQGVVDVLLLPSTEHRQKRRQQRQQRRPIHHNMGKILKTLVHVHGLQILRDGVYNADPHPGNVLILPDGRLGLIDYGMVGRVTNEQRKSIAKTILALHKHDKQAVTDIYKEAGYRASWKEGNVLDDVHILHRFASFHFDRFDLSPVHVLAKDTADEDEQQRQADHNKMHHKNNKEHHGKHQFHLPRFRHPRKPMNVLTVLETTIEQSVPDWVEQGRRLAGLLCGVSLQAGRPLSLAKEWHAIAEDVMQEPDEGMENNSADQQVQ